MFDFERGHDRMMMMMMMIFIFVQRVATTL
jgi:hypothetical protein